MNVRLFPNILTFSRILLTPLVIFLLLSSGRNTFLAGVVFTIASLTDYYDGHFARKYGVISKSGIFLDPFADKVLVLSTFFSFYLLALIPLWMVIIIGLREFLVTGLRLVLIKQGHSLAASPFGKIKTVAQLMAIAFLFIARLLGDHGISLNPYLIDTVMALIIFITCYSGADYFVKNKAKICLTFHGSLPKGTKHK